MGRPRKTITQREYDDLDARLEYATEDLTKILWLVRNRLPGTDTRLVPRLRIALEKIATVRGALPEYIEREGL